jgi:hypothetical protein
MSSPSPSSVISADSSYFLQSIIKRTNVSQPESAVIKEVFILDAASHAV